jgi:hypothetical protein
MAQTLIFSTLSGKAVYSDSALQRVVNANTRRSVAFKQMHQAQYPTPIILEYEIQQIKITNLLELLPALLS